MAVDEPIHPEQRLYEALTGRTGELHTDHHKGYQLEIDERRTDWHLSPSDLVAEAREMLGLPKRR